MYAVIEDRGRQYKAAPGDKLVLDRKAGSDVGATFEVPVLMLANGGALTVGSPHVAGAKAILKVLSHPRGEKGTHVKYMKRKRNLRRHGFRHDQTVVEVVSIA